MNLSSPARLEALREQKSGVRGADTAELVLARDKLAVSIEKGGRCCGYIVTADPKIVEGVELRSELLLTIQEAALLRGSRRVVKCYFQIEDVIEVGATVNVRRCTVGKDMLECSLG